ncbi:hypothetical protein M1N05_00730 [Dehalococcoidales bacterium]|nr:hypothetical protein [Dehalococcoidales bacterium]MCL0091282.1 hypothetical protein [Dehalococcoidales bacterium]
MAKLVKAKDVEQVVRRYLEGKGCTLSPPKKYGQTGTDITAKCGKSTWFVEVIGFQSHPPTRSREFYEAFFRVISRDRNNPDDALVLALPKRFKNGIRQRKQQYPVAWEKLGKAFPNLRLWYVDIEKNIVEEYPWSNPY